MMFLSSLLSVQNFRCICLVLIKNFEKRGNSESRTVGVWLVDTASPVTAAAAAGRQAKPHHRLVESAAAGAI